MRSEADSAPPTGVVGDTRSDVQAGRRLGMKVLAVKTGFSENDGLVEADVLLDDLTDTGGVLDLLRI